MVLESAIPSPETRKGLEASLETGLQTSCVAYLCLVSVSLFGNAGLWKRLLSSSEEVTIDHSQCRSSWCCMNYVPTDRWRRELQNVEQLGKLWVCCLTHSSKCSLYQQAVPYGLVSLILSCVNGVSWVRCQEVDPGLSGCILVIAGSLMQPVGLVNAEQFLVESLWTW